MSEINKYNLSNVGYERFISDVRQLGGFLMVFGVSFLTLPQTRLAMWLGHDSNPDPSDDLQGLMQVIGGLCEVLVGATSLWVGYVAIGHDGTSKWMTRLLIGITVLLLIPLGTELADVVKKTSMGPESSPFFANKRYEPTSTDIKFVGSMGFIGVVGWYGGLLASLAFCQRALLVFAKGQPELRSRAFYQSRLVFFSVLTLIAGVSQLLLGIFLLMQYGPGPMPYGAVRVAMYVIHFPEIAIAVGGFQTLTSILGLTRAAGKFSHPQNHIFQVAVILSWLGTLGGTTMTQIYYSGPRMMDVTRAPTMVVLTLGLHILPSFFDYKMRNLPYIYPEEFYDPRRMTNHGDRTPNANQDLLDTDFSDENDGIHVHEGSGDSACHDMNVVDDNNNKTTASNENDDDNKNGLIQNDMENNVNEINNNNNGGDESAAPVQDDPPIIEPAIVTLV